MAVMGLALPDSAGSDEPHFRAPAGGADHALRPALRHKVRQAIVQIAVVNDCFLQGYGVFFLCHALQSTPKWLLCQVYYCQNHAQQESRLARTSKRANGAFAVLAAGGLVFE